MGTEILLYVPNLIGYFRFVLIIASSCLSDYPLYFVALYSLSSLLDGVDGIAARRLNQISAFGAWLDVVVDLVGRGMVWCLVSQRWGYYMAVLEWTTFICTHSRGPEWKSSFEEAPWFAQMVMAKGFKTPAGFLAVGSLHVLPVWVYGYQTDFMSQYLRIPLCGQYGGMAVLVLGRLLCMSVEIYCIVDYVLHMVHPQTTTVTVITSKGESSNPVKPK